LASERAADFHGEDGFEPLHVDADVAHDSLYPRTARDERRLTYARALTVCQIDCRSLSTMTSASSIPRSPAGTAGAGNQESEVSESPRDGNLTPQ
ncbi:MAG: hypothetical protein ACREUG_08435, partial [Steroidobacteraceae bacterium]